MLRDTEPGELGGAVRQGPALLPCCHRCGRGTVDSSPWTRCGGVDEPAFLGLGLFAAGLTLLPSLLLVCWRPALPAEGAGVRSGGLGWLRAMPGLVIAIALLPLDLMLQPPGLEVSSNALDFLFFSLEMVSP